MRFLILCATMLLAACSATAPSGDVQPYTQADYDAQYAALVDTVKDRASPDQFVELRHVYVHTSHYQPYQFRERSLSQAMFETAGRGDWRGCVDRAEEILAFNYISLTAHYGAMNCNFEAGHDTQGDYHRYVLDNLLEAIWATGDGQSLETAFFSTNTQELYAFINLHGLEAVDQSLVHHQGKSYDLMGVRDRNTGKEYEWYFDISAQWAAGIKSLK